MNSQTIINEDLNYILKNLKEEFESLRNRTLLITGGAGFLGYYLVKSIIHWNDIEEKKGSSVIKLIVYDNFVRGLPKWISDIKSKSYLKIKKHDINDPLPSEIGEINYVIHAASIASPTYYRKNPITTMDANVNGLRNLLDFIKQISIDGKYVGGLLYFSTSEIYGDPDKFNIPTSESYRGNVSCTGPRACYDESKRYGETLCVNFAKQFNLPIKIARPFNNYGPGLKISDGRAISDFCSNILDDKDVIMFSDGRPTRTFCYVADAIIGYFKILVKGKSGEPYNIGAEGPEISIREIAEMIIDTGSNLFGYKGKLIFKMSADKDYLSDNPNRRAPIINKAKDQLSFNPSININEGLRRSLIWYKDNNEDIQKL